VWIFFETAAAIVRENTTHMSQLGKKMLRVALGAMLCGCSRGAFGAWLARPEARGLACTLFVMAANLALIAVMLPSGAPPYLARNMAILHGVFVAVFPASRLLFRHATFPHHGLLVIDPDWGRVAGQPPEADTSAVLRRCPIFEHSYIPTGEL
jgi:hypothetical protein